MATKAWQAHIYTPGSTNTSSGNIDFTLGSSQLAGPVTVRHPTVLPLSGRSEAQPWDLTIVDRNSSFTAQLADSSGRLDLLGRIVVVNRNLDGAGFVRHGAGRIADVQLGDNIAEYRLVLDDERQLERQALVFNTTNTTRIYPPGVHDTYGPFFASPIEGKARGKVGFRLSTTIAKVQLYDDVRPLLQAGFDTIEADIANTVVLDNSATGGNFTHTRLRVGDTDYEVHSFYSGGIFQDPEDAGAPVPKVPEGELLESLEKHLENGGAINMWVVATSSEMMEGDELSSAFLHQMGGPPTESRPLHIGGALGLHPATLTKQIAVDGTYSSSGTVLPRYSTTALDTLLTEPATPLRFRITGPEVMSQFLEDKVWAVSGYAPFQDTSGVIHVRNVWLPNSTSAITYTFGSSNQREHPTWFNTARELATVLQVHYTHERLGNLTDQVASNDRLTVTRTQKEVTHDRVGQIGRRVQTVEAVGLHTYGPSPEQEYAPRLFHDAVNRIKQEIFDRYGDGPIVGQIQALSSAESVQTGDIVKLSLDTYPNPYTQARGSTRFVQLLSRVDSPQGPAFDYIDVGPSLTPVSAPTITLSTSTSDDHHSVIATVGSVPSNGAFELQAANSATAPSSGSTDWLAVETTGTTAGAYVIGKRPSGTKVWARTRATAPRRLRSAWTTSTGKTTATLTAPSAIAVPATGIAGGRAVITVTVGETRYPLHWYADTSTTATFGSSNFLGETMPDTRRFEMENLAVNTTYYVGCRHADQYGGKSAADSTVFATSASFGTAPNMLGLAILSGQSIQ